MRPNLPSAVALPEIKVKRFAMLKNCASLETSKLTLTSILVDSKIGLIPEAKQEVILLMLLVGLLYTKDTIALIHLLFGSFLPPAGL